VRHGGSNEYHALKNEWETSSSVDGKEISLRALGRLQSPELLTDYLGFLCSTVAVQANHFGSVFAFFTLGRGVFRGYREKVLDVS
jgi:hypothetical protein